MFLQYILPLVIKTFKIVKGFFWDDFIPSNRQRIQSANLLQASDFVSRQLEYYEPEPLHFGDDELDEIV